MTCGASQHYDSASIAQAFARHFLQVYDPPSSSTFVSSLTELYPRYVSPLTLNERVVHSATLRLKNTMTSGPDGIPSFFLTRCASQLALPLSILFKLSLQTGVFPQQWKSSRITPVFKSGVKTLISNYRPIAVLSNFSKIFEICIYDYISIAVSHAITPSQHGFIKNRSTVTNLASFSQYIADSLDHSRQVDVIFTDFSKAFDKINHYILLTKMSSQFGFHPSFLQFLHSYLSNRDNFVQVRGARSFSYISTSGIPQGSNLGPLPFSLYINDISGVIASPFLLYAHDLKIFLSINSLDSCTQLQDDLRRLHTWSVENMLPLNVNKCKTLTFSTGLSYFHYQYVIGNSVLERVSKHKDLGVVFDSKLNFSIHVSRISVRANKLLSFIVRSSKHFKSIVALKALYYSFVRSLLEYASLVWNPSQQYNISILERIQKKFLKFLAFKIDGRYPEQGANYAELCSRFNVPSLASRRMLHSLLFLFKLFNQCYIFC